jgi:hypothetical protein
VGQLPDVVAVALGGSMASGLDDALSDVDLYAYWRHAPVPIEDRRLLADRLGRGDPIVGQTFWEAGDYWYDSASGAPVDVVFRCAPDFREGLLRVRRDCQAAMGTRGKAADRPGCRAVHCAAGGVPEDMTALCVVDRFSPRLVTLTDRLVDGLELVVAQT